MINIAIGKGGNPRDFELTDAETGERLEIPGVRKVTIVLDADKPRARAELEIGSITSFRGGVDPLFFIQPFSDPVKEIHFRGGTVWKAPGQEGGE